MADNTEATPAVDTKATPKATPAKCCAVDGYCQKCGAYAEANA